MEAFEAFVALTLEAEDLVVSEAVKHPVKLQTARASHPEYQKHWYEVDLVGARADRLVLASVKSFFGSSGVKGLEVQGRGKNARGNANYKLLNRPEIRETVVGGLAARFGYTLNQVQLRLYVGAWANAKTGKDEQLTREWCAKQAVGAGSIQVYDLKDVVPVARQLAKSKTYRNNPALVAIKVLDAAGALMPEPL